MKKKLITLGLVSTLLVGCGSTQNISSETKETSVEKIVTKDPIMKLLVSGLIIYSVQILFAR
jgi:uncharacterized protein YcfL|tara:strand:+ start:36 stop:221 length:186 start_codon:yes stop_codon:yes gene_type:complete